MRTVRPFRDEDEADVLQLANSHAAFDGTTSEADLAIASHFLVAEEDGKIVGFAYGYMKDVPEEVLERWHAHKVGHVQLMAVDPASRRRGTGSALLSGLLEEFKASGADMVTLDCPAEATDAKRLCERRGFSPRCHGRMMCLVR